MKACLLCGIQAVVPAIDFGRQALCNRFLETPAADEATFPLAVGACHACGVVQLLDPLPCDELKPRVSWLTYNEPEGHLDDLAATIARLPGLDETSAICGISFKDDSLLRRLEKIGRFRTGRLDPIVDLGIRDSCAGIETIQSRLTSARAGETAMRNGQADVVIARHIFEHASDPAGFAAALKQLVAPGGYLVLEVPDCEKALDLCDYTTIWEEHSLYLTPYTFHRALESLGLEIRASFCIPYVLENSLIAITRVVPRRERFAAEPKTLKTHLRRARHFADGFGARRAAVTRFVEGFRRQRGRIAIFGAGHLACTFVNLFGIADFVDCVLDDNPNKVGLYMPGSHLPIEHSRALLDRDISLCLLSVGAGGERTVIEKHHDFLDRGGRFHSIFPSSSLAIDA